MIVDRINAYLAGEGKTVDEAILADVAALARYAFERQFGLREEKKRGVWFSSLGRCLRQQAYDALGIPQNGKTIDSRAKMVFFQGDMVELAVVKLAQLAGCNITECGADQQRVEWEGSSGRPDGIYHNGSDYLLEVKSMSSFRFSDFEKGVIDEGYLFQVNAGLEAKGLEKALILGLNKDAGVLAEKLVTKDPAMVAELRRRIETLKNVKSLEDLPPRPYAPNDKHFYPWNCLYCAHWKTCLPDAEQVLVGRAYKLKDKGGLK